MNEKLNEALNELATKKYNLEREIEKSLNNFATLNGVKIEGVDLEIYETFNGKMIISSV